MILTFTGKDQPPFSHGFPMIFPWFSHDSHGFPIKPPTQRRLPAPVSAGSRAGAPGLAPQRLRATGQWGGGARAGGEGAHGPGCFGASKKTHGKTENPWGSWSIFCENLRRYWGIVKYNLRYGRYKHSSTTPKPVLGSVWSIICYNFEG